MSKMQTQWGNICNRVDTCALTGAAAFVAGITDSKMLVNGPLWCYFYALRYLERIDYTISYRLRGSQPDNTAVVYGAEKYIVEALDAVRAEQQKPSILLLESSCSMSLIGDDLAGIVRKQNLPFPVVTMDCGGMIGGFAEGYARAGQKVFEQLNVPAGKVHPLAVNIIGQTDYYLQGRADTEELKRLLRLAGYEVLATPGSGCSVEELQQAGCAALNIVTNVELGLPIAKFLEKRFGTPYVVAGLPYGVQGTLDWFKRIDAVLACPQMAAVQAEIDAMQTCLNMRNSEARLLWGNLWFDEVLVSAPAATALCMAQALRTEWADMGRLTVICQQDIKNELSCEAADAVYTVGKDDEAIAAYLQNCNNVFLLASSSEGSVLYRRADCSFSICNIACPYNDEVILQAEPCVGLKGNLYMLQRLWNKFIALQLKQKHR